MKKFSTTSLILSSLLLFSACSDSANEAGATDNSKNPLTVSGKTQESDAKVCLDLNNNLLCDLDEVQTINYSLWQTIRETFQIIGEMFNVYYLIFIHLT